MPDGSSCILSGEMSPLPFAHSVNELFGCLFILQSSFAAELYEWAPVCFRYQPLMRSVFCKYFLLFLSRLLVLPMAPLLCRSFLSRCAPTCLLLGSNPKNWGPDLCRARRCQGLGRVLRGFTVSGLPSTL